MPAPQHEKIGQLGQRNAAVPQSGSSGQEHGFLFKQRSHNLTDLCYTAHQRAPVRTESTSFMALVSHSHASFSSSSFTTFTPIGPYLLHLPAGFAHLGCICPPCVI